MAESRRTNNNSAIENIGPGIYEAIVVNHLDRTYMGSLLVDVLKKSASGNPPERIGTSIEARYLMPFYGVTPFAASQPNDGYSVTQKSYGMWMVPPDIGTRVLVLFVEEDIARCYWIGCVPDQYMNFMVPDGRASTVLTTEGTPENLRGKKLPVGEYNKKTEQGTINDPTRFNKPFNKDFTQVLEIQGLIDDENRGTTTSSARREVPSMVFGINTPGPLDKRTGAPRTPQGQEGVRANIPSNRLGGSSFVMDDGDDKFVRKTTADAGPPEYVSREIGETGGDPTIPHNELLRLRTRTGHQILMHNSEDLIYIANARGTAWVELTSDGKIDIYANDSISVHSDNDINLTSGRDFNVEAGRNINMRANARYTDGDDAGGTSGNIQIESIHNTNIRIDGNLKVHVQQNRDDYVKENFKTTVEANREISITGFYRNYVVGEIALKTDDSFYAEATSGNANLIGNTDVKLKANGGNLSLQAGGFIAGDGSPNVYWNSGKSVAADPATAATPGATVTLLPEYNVPLITPGSLVSNSTSSIVKRVPQHEPWVHHENLNPLAFKPDKTDILNSEPVESGTTLFTEDTFRKGLVGSSNAGTGRQPGPRAVSQAAGASSEAGAPPAATGPVTVPSDLIDYIISKEGFHATPYWDYEQWTNGYGTRARSQTETITREEARRRLEVDVNSRREYVVRYAQERGYNWTDDQINALTSFIYNLGTGRLNQVTENGTRNDTQIRDAILRYNRAGGEVLQGLVNRRNEESAWFAQGIA